MCRGHTCPPGQVWSQLRPYPDYCRGKATCLLALPVMDTFFWWRTPKYISDWSLASTQPPGWAAHGGRTNVVRQTTLGTVSCAGPARWLRLWPSIISLLALPVRNNSTRQGRQLVYTEPEAPTIDFVGSRRVFRSYDKTFNFLKVGTDIFGSRNQHRTALHSGLRDEEY